MWLQTVLLDLSYGMGFYHWASVFLCAADVHQHEENGDEQGRPPRHLLDRNDESNEWDESQNCGWQKCIEVEWSRHPFHGDLESREGTVPSGQVICQVPKIQFKHLCGVDIVCVIQVCCHFLEEKPLGFYVV